MFFIDWFNQYYTNGLKEDALKKVFSDKEKEILRPIAETLALLDGNAFFTMEGSEGKEWYEMYLPEANMIYQSNGGDNGWAGEASFAKRILNNDREIQD